MLALNLMLAGAGVLPLPPEFVCDCLPLPKAKFIVYYSLIWRFKLFSPFSFAG